MLRSLVILSLFHVIYPAPLGSEDGADAGRSADLSYLGSSVFGSPKESVGRELEHWNESAAVNPEELGEYAEGDILFPETARNGLVAKSTRWKDGVVPYEISPLYPVQAVNVIKKAMDIYHKYTCIKFRPRLPSDDDYISIVNGPTGCWSSVGRITGRQEVNLQSPSCTSKVGTPLHEIMHALGFVHEHTRPERDDYVAIAWQNIKKGHEGNFKKAEKGSTDGYGVSYDFRSVMHYSPTAFSVNGSPTIVPKDSGEKSKMGQRDGFSRGDIKKLNAMYGCSNKLPGEGDPEEISGGQPDSGGGGGGLLSLLLHIVK